MSTLDKNQDGHAGIRNISIPTPKLPGLAVASLTAGMDTVTPMAPLGVDKLTASLETPRCGTCSCLVSTHILPALHLRCVYVVSPDPCGPGHLHSLALNGPTSVGSVGWKERAQRLHPILFRPSKADSPLHIWLQ